MCPVKVPLRNATVRVSAMVMVWCRRPRIPTGLRDSEMPIRTDPLRGLLARMGRRAIDHPHERPRLGFNELSLQSPERVQSPGTMARHDMPSFQKQRSTVETRGF